MHSRVLFIGLSGLGVAVGSVCRPRTTALSASVSLSTAEVVTLSTSATESETSTAATTSTTDETLLPSSTTLDTEFLSTGTASTGTESTDILIESTTITIDTSLLPTAETSSETRRLQTSTQSAATTLETSIVVTTSVDISSTTAVDSTTTSGDTSLLTTTEDTTLETSVTVTTSTEIPTTTLETSVAVTTSADISATTLAETTTTSEPQSIPTAFKLVASTGTKAGQTLKIGTYSFASASFEDSPSTVPIAWVPETGNLRVSNNLFLCASYNTGVPGAEIISCNSNTLTTSLLVCEALAGQALKCKAPDCHITFSGFTGPQRVCPVSAEPWTQFYSNRAMGSVWSWRASMGRDILNPDYTPIEFKIVSV